MRTDAAFTRVRSAIFSSVLSIIMESFACSSIFCISSSLKPPPRYHCSLEAFPLISSSRCIETIRKVGSGRVNTTLSPSWIKLSFATLEKSIFPTTVTSTGKIRVLSGKLARPKPAIPRALTVLLSTMILWKWNSATSNSLQSLILFKSTFSTSLPRQAHKLVATIRHPIIKLNGLLKNLFIAVLLIIFLTVVRIHQRREVLVRH